MKPYIKLLALLFLLVSGLEIMANYFAYQEGLMLITGYGQRIAVPGWDWWAMATVQAVTTCLLAWLLIKWRMYGVMTALILLMGVLLWQLW